jgi:pentatricopeptide repeat protein
MVFENLFHAATAASSTNKNNEKKHKDGVQSTISRATKQPQPQQQQPRQPNREKVERNSSNFHFNKSDNSKIWSSAKKPEPHQGQQQKQSPVKNHDSRSRKRQRNQNLLEQQIEGHQQQTQRTSTLNCQPTRNRTVNRAHTPPANSADGKGGNNTSIKFNHNSQDSNRSQTQRQNRVNNSNTKDRHRDRSDNTSHNKKQKRHFVSPLAIELSIVLKDLSQQKKLQEILSLYWNNISPGSTIDIKKYSTVVRDNHHSCVVIDCCSRCGDMISAERIYDQLVANQTNSSSTNIDNGISIEIYTAMLKGYAHSGDVVKMMKLFHSLNTSECTPMPNVRTINTVLRGCLWTPAIVNTDSTTGSNDKQQHKMVGGVVSSEHLWQTYQQKQILQQQEQQRQSSASSFFDVSSYEYSISLLCQALCTTVAQQRINDFQKLHNISIRGKATVVLNSNSSSYDSETGSSILEVIAICYLALGRAYSILGDDTLMWIAIQRSLSSLRSSRTMLSESTQTAATNPSDLNDITSMSKHKKQKKNDNKAGGGKRSWKNVSSGSDQQQQHDQSSTTRYNSNYAYRMHRLSEIESDSMLLIKSRLSIKDMNRSDVVKCYINNLLCFNGGGTTSILGDHRKSTTSTSDTDNHASAKSSSHQSVNPTLLVPTIYSFGLAKLAQVDIFDMTERTIPDTEEIIKKVSNMYNIQCRSPIDTHGCLQLNKIYDDETKPLDIELGAGFGSWIVNQAQHNCDRNFLAIELRSDRVYQILARAIVQFHGKLNNLCIVGCDSYTFFHRRRVSNQSVTTIFINHPEPPTQTYGDNIKQLQLLSTVSNTTSSKGSETEDTLKSNEPSHMLHSSTILEMIPCLKIDGKIVIVTDNKSYVRLLAATFSKVMQLQQNTSTNSKNNSKKKKQKTKDAKAQIRSMKVNEVQKFNTSLRLLETFGGNVNIFQGEQPPVSSSMTTTGTQVENPNNGVGTSYFDRLWRTGAGSHSERLNRFVLVFIREK